MSKHSTLKRNIVRGLMGLFAILMVVFLLNSPLLKIGYVKVTGNTYLPRDEVLQIARLKEPINIFAVQTDVEQNYLESDLRIESARVWRDFPNCLNIDITERVPMAVMNCDYGYVAIDKNGVIIDTYRDIKKINKPIISGEILQNVYTGDNVNDELVKRVLEYLGLLDQDSMKQVMQINISNKDNVVVYTAIGTKLILGNMENPNDLAMKTINFFGDLKTTAIPIDYIDFSYSRPVFKVK